MVMVWRQLYFLSLSMFAPRLRMSIPSMVFLAGNKILKTPSALQRWLQTGFPTAIMLTKFNNSRNFPRLLSSNNSQNSRIFIHRFLFDQERTVPHSFKVINWKASCRHFSDIFLYGVAGVLRGGEVKVPRKENTRRVVELSVFFQKCVV